MLFRSGFEKPEIRALQKAYKEIYRLGKTMEEVKPILAEMAKEWPAVEPMLTILESTERGIIR